jgi:hypothetical protein
MFQDTLHPSETCFAVTCFKVTQCLQRFATVLVIRLLIKVSAVFTFSDRTGWCRGYHAGFCSDSGGARSGYSDRFLVVVFSISRQILGQYLDHATTAASQILSNPLVTSHSICLYNWTLRTPSNFPLKVDHGKSTFLSDSPRFVYWERWACKDCILTALL